jgi:hypothetical protein
METREMTLELVQSEQNELKDVKQERDDLRKQLELVQFEQSELKSRLSKFFGKDQIDGTKII